MKVTLTHGDKTVELDLTAEQMETLGLKEEKKKTGYERVEGVRANYFYEAETGGVLKNMIGPLGINVFDSGEFLYDNGNYYSHPQVAENNARADRLIRKLRRYAAEHGGIPSVEDWKGHFVYKWYIIIDHNAHSRMAILPFKSLDIQHQSSVYFKSKEACISAIEEFKDELMWYFTEYQAMLY